jgi:hypothetical protein
VGGHTLVGRLSGIWTQSGRVTASKCVTVYKHFGEATVPEGECGPCSVFASIYTPARTWHGLYMTEDALTAHVMLTTYIHVTVIIYSFTAVLFVSLWCGETLSNKSRFRSPDDRERMWNMGGMITVWVIRSVRHKRVPMQFCPWQIPHKLPCERNQASAVRNRWLTAWGNFVSYL